MLAVVSVLSTSLVAVPALSRVEPARTSGPGAGAMTTFALTPRARLHVTITVRAPARRAAASPPRTNRVTPLADTPTTTSPAGAEGHDDQIDGGGDLARDAPDRAHGAHVLAIHQRGDAAGVETVQARARAVGPLGGEPLIAEAARHGAHGITGCATIGSVPAVLTGLDVLLRDHLSSLQGRAVGLLS